MAEKIRIKVGTLELEWESDESLSLDNVKSLLREVETLSPASSGPPRPLQDARGEAAAGGQAAKSSASQKLFVTSIAAKLNAKTGGDLARAAAAYLQLSENKESFTRVELLEAMKKAPMYFTTSMRKNLSSIISSLIPDTFNQIGESSYCLTATAYSALEATLA